MTEIVPHGYISVREAVNRLGPELFPEAWTGKEHEARRGLTSEDEWLAPARGGGALGSAPLPTTIAASAATALHSTGDPSSSSTRGGDAPGSAPAPIAAPVWTALHRTGDPSSSSYQAEYRARKRYEDTCDRLRALLEAGELEAAILDPFTGKLHRASTALWRRFDANRMIEKGRARIPHSLNTGSLVVKEFPVQSTPRRPLPTSKIGDVIDALREKVATEYLRRPQQKDFVGRRFRNYRVNKDQFREIFKEVPVATGRPRESDKKV
jgi:hypothetical protein